MTAEPVIIAAYSPRKKSANFIDEYSVWYPPTNSVSDSGRSKGRRFVSANIDIVKTMNEMKSGIQRRILRMSNNRRISCRLMLKGKKADALDPNRRDQPAMPDLILHDLR
jgi:hypothetical protein